MNSQIKYIVQGILLLLLVMFVFKTILLIGSLRLSESESTIVLNNTLPKQPSDDGYTKGEALFSANCASCHAINKRLTGPALAGFEERGLWKDRKQVYAWIRNPEGYMKSNVYAKELYKEYQVMMTPFPDLSYREIDAIVNAINRHENQPSLPVASVLYFKAKF